MGLFKRAPAPAETPQAPRPQAVEASGEARLDNALDTVACLIRNTGQIAFPLLDDASHEEFVQACEDWARHVLTGTAPPLEGAAEMGLGLHAWADLLAFHRQRRQDEKRFVSGRFEDFRGLIWDLIGELRVIAGTSRDSSDVIRASLEQLEQAVSGQSIDELRPVLSATVTSIRRAVESQRRTVESQLQQLNSRLQTMRRDLYLVREQMKVDALTQLYNRGAFETALGHYVDVGLLVGQPVALMMVDLDHFKQVNDRYGHRTGDRVLVEAANCLARCYIRKDDFIARYGGEEFAVLLPDVDAKTATGLAERFLERLRSTPVEADGRQVQLTASIGFACLAPDDSPETLIERADEALYQAKANGRDRACGN